MRRLSIYFRAVTRPRRIKGTVWCQETQKSNRPTTCRLEPNGKPQRGIRRRVTCRSQQAYPRELARSTYDQVPRHANAPKHAPTAATALDRRARQARPR